MADNKVFMDTNIFTEVVNSIGISASNCVLSKSVLDKVDTWDNTAVGKKMTKLLKDVLNSSKVYKDEAGMTLPASFLKMRDSMINVDNAAASSLKVDVNKR